jgi:polysaccharide biosynthesis transport protein
MDRAWIPQVAALDADGRAVNPTNIGAEEVYTPNDDGTMTTSAEKSRSGGRPSIFRTRKRWIIAVTAAAIAGAAFVSSRHETTFGSHAGVVVEPVTYTNAAPLPPNMGTEKQIAESSAVARIAAASSGLPPSQVGPGLSVSVPADTNVLDFKYTSPRPAEAQRLAGAFASAYVQYRTRLAPEGRKGAGVPGAVDSITIRGEVITAAPLPVSSTGPNYAFNIGFALVVGLALGVGAAALRDRLDKRITEPAELAELSGAPVLGVIPARRRRRTAATPGSMHPDLVAVHDPVSEAGDAYRRLRSRVVRAMSKHQAKILAVTSAQRQEGATVMVANLAAVLAKPDRQVVLLDASPPRPRAHELFGVDRGPDLNDVLLGRVPAAEALRDTRIPGLRLLSGVAPGPRPDLCEGSALRMILGQLLDDAYVVIIGCPPVLASSSSLDLAGAADLVLLVANAQRSSRRRVAEAGAELGWTGAGGHRSFAVPPRLAGAVLTDAPRGLPSRLKELRTPWAPDLFPVPQPEPPRN